MYVGHFAVGMALKSLRPQVPALPILLGVGLMDIVDGILVMTGADRVTPNLSSGPYLYFDLTFIDWDHSLAMALVIATIWGLLFRKDQGTALLAGMAVFSHFLSDWPVHNHDLAVYPFSSAHLGAGLWGRLGVGSWVLEGAFAAGLILFAAHREARSGVRLLWPALLLTVLYFQMSPWLSPMRWVATLPEPATHLLHGFGVSLGFLVPSLILVWLYGRQSAAAEAQPDQLARR